jgi:single-strand DNA-binding protein
MFDTTVCLVGNVMTNPEWRRTTVTGTYVATFRFASTSRRFDKTANRWVDGDSLRIKVACWRTIGENVMQSVSVGDPLVVYGRLYSRDWVDADEHRRTSYEMDAVAVGHDLARGISKFKRAKRISTDTIDDEQSDAAIGGELSELMMSVPPADMPESEPFHSTMYDLGDGTPPEGGDDDRETDDDDLEEESALLAVS